LRFPVELIRSGWICSMDSPFARRRRTVCSMSSVMTGGRPPCLPLRAAVPCATSGRGGAHRPEPFERGLADVLALGLRHRGEEREQQLPRARGVVHAGQGAGEHLQHQAVRGEVIGERGEFSGVAAEPLHLVHREDDAAVRGVRLDLAGGCERILELGAHPNPGADLLAEDFVPGDAVRGERVQLRVELLAEGRAAGVADADVRAWDVRDDRGRGRGAGPPRLSRSPIGRGRHAQQFGEPGHLREPTGVVGAGDRAGARAAGRSGLDTAARAGVTLNIVRVARRGVSRVGHRPGSSHNAVLRSGSDALLSENEF
jgi:hypothetical protein